MVQSCFLICDIKIHRLRPFDVSDFCCAALNLFFPRGATGWLVRQRTSVCLVFSPHILCYSPQTHLKCPACAQASFKLLSCCATPVFLKRVACGLVPITSKDNKLGVGVECLGGVSKHTHQPKSTHITSRSLIKCPGCELCFDTSKHFHNSWAGDSNIEDKDVCPVGYTDTHTHTHTMMRTHWIHLIIPARLQTSPLPQTYILYYFLFVPDEIL